MDYLHYILLGAATLFLLLFLREKKQKKREQEHCKALGKHMDELHVQRQAYWHDLLLRIVPQEKIRYRPAEPRGALNFVYPPPAPEMLVVMNVSAKERAIMDQIDAFLGGKLRAGENFSWIEVPGGVSSEEKVKYPHITT